MGIGSGNTRCGQSCNRHIIENRIASEAPPHHSAKEGSIGSVGGNPLTVDSRDIIIVHRQILHHTAHAELDKAAELGRGSTE